MSILTSAQVDEAGLHDWRLLHHALQTRYRTGDFVTGLSLLNRIAAVAEEMNHHPDLDLRYGHLNIRLFSHDSLGVTGRDVRLARRITDIARDVGVEAVPEGLSVVEIGLDTPDRAAIAPFWAAVLAMESPTTDDEVRDDDGDLPRVWFQESGGEEPRQRFHLDVMVTLEEAPRRIEAALAAGGRLVSEGDAPAFVVLQDAEGNKACICTMQGRHE
ncbi:4a-hydroxytetrahydrobiopterin dehydratase [Nocardioides gilvus]|uniref:4a-hydroxytetrahydrobiopterin dehydratase n=1 Tax=Nocardioides gilvus TaxID=1735589 RepID=UPI000D74C65E|nr:4a-hydroxytetrahydrobiopterin dehydratase [Nocardioides gilvus]